MPASEVIASAEDRLIARYFVPLARVPGAFALADDAAVLTPPAGCDLVLKTDAIIGGVHFFPDDPPDMIAKKALRVNLSDLAAKAARPVGFLLTLALPRETGDAWLSPFAQGLGADAELFGCPLFGGDTDRTPGPITISIAALGVVPHGRMVRRAGARIDDRLVVTGTIGDAALGLRLRCNPGTGNLWRLAPAEREELLARYLVPEPRTAIAHFLAAHASAAMDISDGLVGDLAKLCRASGVTAEVEVERVPLSLPARAALASEPALLETILTGGDDYEVLAAVRVDQVEAFRRQASTAGVAVTDIGRIISGTGDARFIDGHGNPLVFARPSFSHF
jgi:thiamine-monophosphate kinase